MWWLAFLSSKLITLWSLRVVTHLGQYHRWPYEIMARSNCPLLAILCQNPSFFSVESDISGMDEKALRLTVLPLSVLRRCAS